MKEHNKTPENQLNKTEIKNPPDVEFKTLVIRMLNDLSENFNEEIGNIKMEIENQKKEAIRNKDSITGNQQWSS